MTDKSPTTALRRPEPAKLEQLGQETPDDQSAPSGEQGEQSQASSSGRRAAPGRKPLFGS